MPSLILTPRQTADAQALWRTAIARGWGVHRLTTWRISDEARELPDPFLYVEALFGPTLAEELGVQLLDPPEDWLPTLPQRYRKRSIELMPLRKARKLEQPAFVKPPNDKSFPAQVYAPGELQEWLNDDMTVLVSDPVEFTSEYRCFVLDREVRASSIYMRDGELCDFESASDSERRGLAEFAQCVLDDDSVQLPRACVLDVGPMTDLGWGVIELNAAWGSGIYGCDPNVAMDVIRAATRPASV